MRQSKNSANFDISSDFTAEIVSLENMILTVLLFPLIRITLGFYGHEDFFEIHDFDDSLITRSVKNGTFGIDTIVFSEVPKSADLFYTTSS